MDDHIDRVLIDRQAIGRRVGELAAEIAEGFGRDAPDSAELTLLPILTGSVIFLADLIRQLPVMMRLRLVSVSSYPGATTVSLGPQLQSELPEDLSGAALLIVDDILDSGRTLTMVQEMVRPRRPALVRTCVLLRKELLSAMAVPAEYVGFDIPDQFVVGYGLDFDGYYRNLPDIVTLKAGILNRERST